MNIYMLNKVYKIIWAQYFVFTSYNEINVCPSKYFKSLRFGHSLSDLSIQSKFFFLCLFILFLATSYPKTIG